ncbi:hypothetical protein [Tomitella cavernea]|uniref:Uncharacterized protein n=1 Tax=Tomitella cavernea TaxID=1387982 RepID=A0ABP9BY59_9ACTN
MRQAPTASSAAAIIPRVRSVPGPFSITKAAATVAATAGRSQLWKANNTTAGLSDHHSARHPAIRPSSHAVSSPNGAMMMALWSRKAASVCDPMPPSHMSSPLSTGYSTVPPNRLPEAVMPPCRNGKTWLSMSRPIHRYWMSE